MPKLPQVKVAPPPKTQQMIESGKKFNANYGDAAPQLKGPARAPAPKGPAPAPKGPAPDSKVDGAAPKGPAPGKVDGDGKALTTKELDEVTKIGPDGQKVLSDKGKTFFQKLGAKYDNAKAFIKDNYKWMGLALGAITLSSMAIVAQTNADKINGTQYTITSIIKDDTNPAYSIITYSPNHKFRINDTVTITESNSIDPVDGTDLTIYKIIGNGKIRINKSIKVDGSKGMLRCKTDFGNQFGGELADLIDPIVTTGIEVGKDLGNEFLDATGLPTIDDILKIIQDFFTKPLETIKEYWWVILIISLLPSISSSIMLLLSSMK
jgi:hypothetical protein